MIQLTFVVLEDAFKTLPVANIPEMQRSNLAPVILQMKALGVDNVLRFHFLSVGWTTFSWSCASHHT